VSINHCDVCQFEIQVLIHAVQCPGDVQVIFELQDNIFANQALEEGVEQHEEDWIGTERRCRMM
jgi:hypothetical protein